MRQKIYQALFAAVCITLAASCIMVVDPGKDETWQAPAEFRKSVDFQAGGTMAVEHTLGNVVIAGWDNNSLEVVATGRPPEPPSSRQVRLYSAADIEPSVDIRQAGGATRIRTRSLGGPWAMGGLDYTISVPHSVNLDTIRLEQGDLTISDVYGRADVSVTKGNLTIKNFSGPLKAALNAGGADVELLDIRGVDNVDISCKDGDIVLRLEPDAGVTIKAEAPEGQITSEYGLGRSLPAKAFSGRMGSGEAGITLKTLHGNIKILKAGGSRPAVIG
jgi:hypothetical protein